MGAIGLVSNQAANETNSDQQKLLQERIKKLNSIALKLKQSPFKDNIIKECRELFYQDKFEEMLDSKCHLIGFENGVYDLEALEFREGRPDDYISMSTHINYVPYDPSHPAIEGINGFISSIFPKQHIRDFVLKTMGSFLNGGIREEKFHIWTGTGCFAKGTGIMMYDGTVRSVESIRVGDQLMGDDSTPRTVKQLFRGFSDMYKIIPVRGEPFVVNGEHKLVLKFAEYSYARETPDKHGKYVVTWYIYDTDRIIKSVTRRSSTAEGAKALLEEARSQASYVHKDDVITISVRDYLAMPTSIQSQLAVYRADFVNFEKREHKLDPWYVGYWLGNGTSADTSITSAEKEVYDYCEQMAERVGCYISSEREKGLATTFYIAGKEWRNNAVLDGLRYYNLIDNKHVPDDYKFTDKETRLQILAGIVDSDGHYQEAMKQIEITLKSERLIDDTIWLARSLGFSCYKHKIQKKCCNNGKVGTYFRIQIVGHNLYELPTKVPRKKPDQRTDVREPRNLKFKVERINDDQFYGFEINGNHRFLMDDFVVLRNSNGKSKLIELFESSFGDYCCKFPITLLTMKRAVSNAPTPEIARSKGRRFAVLQEPSEDEKMNVGLMKELTGGDKIIARQLHKDPIEFKPQFKMVLTCNHLPNVPSDDGGTWRRIRVVEFTSRFCEEPDPAKPNEFKMDKDLGEKFEIWKEHYMSLLIEYYKRYLVEGCKEPDEVLKCTRDYQRSNDIMMDFYEQEIEKMPGQEDTWVSVTDVHKRFNEWIKDNAPSMKNMITKKTLKAALEKHLKFMRIGGVECFYECRLRTGALYDIAEDALD